MVPANKYNHAIMSAMQEGLRLRRQGFCLGTDANDPSAHPAKRYLRPDDALKNNWHVIGPSGSGKTFFLYWLSQVLAFLPQAVVILLDPKPGGPLYRKTRDWAIARGLTKRLVLWDLSAASPPGYNPNRKNGLAPATQAKANCEAVRSAWGQATFDATPQLKRWLFLAFYIARLLELTLIETVELLRPDSSLRRQLIPRISDPEARRGLEYLDTVGVRRIDELTASGVARLEAFTTDPFLRAIFTQRPELSLDVDAIITGQKLFLVNFGTYNPMRIDDVKLIARFLINDILAHVFKNGSEHRPVFLFLDEAHLLVSHDLCAALDMGRESGLRTIISHQFLHQLMDEDTSGYLLHSVLTDARVKIIFGNLPPEDLEILTKPIHVKTYRPWWVMDTIEMPIFAPIEETRIIITTGESYSRGQAVARPESVSESEASTATYGLSANLSRGTQESASHALTKGKSKGTSLERGINHTVTENWSSMHAESAHWAEMEGEGEAHSEIATQSSASGSSGGSDYGTAIDNNGEITNSYHSQRGWNNQAGSSTGSGHATSRFSARTRGGSTTDADSVGGSVARGVSAALGEQHTESESETAGKMTGTSLERGLGASASLAKTTGKTLTHGVTPSESEERGESTSVTTAPFHAYQERTVPSSRTHLTPEGQALLHVQRAQGQPKAHFLAITPENNFAYVRAPWIKEPRVLASLLAAGLERVRWAQVHEAMTTTVIEGDVVTPAPAAVQYQAAQVVNHEHEQHQPSSSHRSSGGASSGQPSSERPESFWQREPPKLPLRAPRRKKPSPGGQ